MAIIRVYRLVISPAKSLVFGPAARCRFTPSCSAYALEAVRTHGAFAGSWLAIKRIGRCHPWGGCGHDPVPPKTPPTDTPVMLHGPVSHAEAAHSGQRCCS